MASRFALSRAAASRCGKVAAGLRHVAVSATARCDMVRSLGVSGSLRAARNTRRSHATRALACGHRTIDATSLHGSPACDAGAARALANVFVLAPAAHLRNAR
ncbi:hypothetical protein [Luteimonas sp. 9C]|uniref:hypothetical protein n=1 Tax=Luteimonas sp. 9C TaxID=2653148 RepID=UPI0013594D9A|nr:hypothetical protein [Luteimonas sp. 9C]